MNVDAKRDFGRPVGLEEVEDPVRRSGGGARLGDAVEELAGGGEEPRMPVKVFIGSNDQETSDGKR